MVGGGGSGGNGDNSAGGGGGVGGVIEKTDFPISQGSNTIVIGTGGTRNTNSKGTNTTAFGLTALGGGSGKYGAQGGTGGGTNANGGSGGGGMGWSSAAGGTGSSGQGNNGGSGADTGSSRYSGGGGGGGSSGGGNGTESQGGRGGFGYTSSISGASTVYAGGGGGGGTNVGANGGAGGTGGGGTGGTGNIDNAADATGYGSGGGGAGQTKSGGAGFQGLVIIRYSSNTNPYALLLSSASSQYCYTTGANLQSITGAKTFEGWVYVTGNAINTIISKWEGTAGNKGYIFSIDANLNLSFTVSTDGNNSITYLSGDNSVARNTCAHAAVVFDGAGNVKFYTNGLLIATVSSVSATYNNSSGSFRIGATGLGDYYDGRLDDVRIWNVARSDSDIFNNYTRQLGGNETGLVAYYRFNNTYTDSGPSGYTLSVSGIPSFTDNVCFTDNTSTSTSTSTTSTSTSTTSTSTSTTSTSSSTTTSTSRTTSTSTTSTITTTSTTTTSTSTTSTSTSTTSTSSSTSTTTSTSTSTTITMDLRLIVEKAK